MGVIRVDFNGCRYEIGGYEALPLTGDVTVDALARQRRRAEQRACWVAARIDVEKARKAEARVDQTQRDQVALVVDVDPAVEGIYEAGCHDTRSRATLEVDEDWCSRRVECTGPAVTIVGHCDAGRYENVRVGQVNRARAARERADREASRSHAAGADQVCDDDGTRSR